MAKFDAGAAVEPLEYDLSAYGGSVGVVPEPSSGQVKAYFRGMKQLAKEVRKFKGIADELGEIDDLTDEEIADRMSKIEEAEEGADHLSLKQKEALATLCQNQPSFDELDRLPFRVFQAFNTWLLAEISPKKEARDSKP